MNYITSVIGNTHLLLLHLPIGIMVLAAFLVLWSYRQQSPDFQPIIRLSVKIAACAAVVSACCGWFLAKQGGYDDQALWWHQWVGLGAALCCCMCWWVIKSSYFNLALLGTTGMIGLAGHFGGNLSYGSDYLWTRPERDVLVTGFKPDDPAYSTLIQPILKRKCVKCHSSSKAKGGLVLDTYENLLKGGDKGLEIVFGSADSSALYRRLILPIHEKEHMPPKGKAQLKPEEIDIIKKWLDLGGNLGVEASKVI